MASWKSGEWAGWPAEGDQQQSMVPSRQERARWQDSGWKDEEPSGPWDHRNWERGQQPKAWRDRTRPQPQSQPTQECMYLRQHNIIIVIGRLQWTPAIYTGLGLQFPHGPNDRQSDGARRRRTPGMGKLYRCAPRHGKAAGGSTALHHQPQHIHPTTTTARQPRTQQGHGTHLQNQHPTDRRSPTEPPFPPAPTIHMANGVPMVQCMGIAAIMYGNMVVPIYTTRAGNVAAHPSSGVTMLDAGDGGHNGLNANPEPR